MERIHYAGGSVLTGTEIAEALIGYAEALAKGGDSATVTVPARHDDGSRGTAHFLIGPASQLVSESEPTDLEEIVDPEVVDHFVAETKKLTTHVVRPSDDGDYTASSIDDLEYPGIEFTNGVDASPESTEQ
jgi:hypothetical protein